MAEEAQNLAGVRRFPCQCPCLISHNVELRIQERHRAAYNLSV